MDSAVAIVAVGLLVFLAHLFAALYEKTRVPDVVPLVLVGILLGPICKVVDTHQFGSVGGFFTTFALVIILFESGLSLKLESLKRSWYLAGRISLATLCAITLTTGLVSYHIFNIGVFEALIFGLLLSATSPMAVSSIISKLKISDKLKAVLLLDSTAREVLAIVLTLACFNMLKNAEQPMQMLGELIASFILATAMGIVAAIIWSSLLKTMRSVRHSIFCTPAFVCVVFGCAELLGYSGPLSSLAFGAVLGNIEELKLPTIPFLPKSRSSLTTTEIGFFSAICFLLKTLFFVYLGISMRLSDPYILFLSLIIAVWIFLARLLIVKYTVAKSLTPHEAAIVSFMLPKGLAAAVLASMLVQSAMPDCKVLQQVAYGVILITICLTSLMMFLIEKGYLDKVILYVFPPEPEVSRSQDAGTEYGANI